MSSALPVDAPAQAERRTAQAPRIAASRMMMVPFRGSNLPGSKVCHIQGNLSVRRSRLREAGSGQGGKGGHSVPAAGSGGAAASGRRRAIRLPGDHFGSAPVSPRRHRVRPRIWQVTNPRGPACPRAGATSAPARQTRADCQWMAKPAQPSAFALARSGRRTGARQCLALAGSGWTQSEPYNRISNHSHERGRERRFVPARYPWPEALSRSSRARVSFSDDRLRHADQNRKYRCAIGRTSAGSQVSSSPSARTS